MLMDAPVGSVWNAADWARAESANPATARKATRAAMAARVAKVL